MKLSERLTSLRKERNVTLSEVSRAVGCSLQYLQKLEKDKCFRPKIELLQKISNYYNFSPDILITEAMKIPPDAYWKVVRNTPLLQIIRDYSE